MNQERPLIKLYRTRTFGEKMSDTFDFVRENWRPMLKYLTYLLLPLALVQSFTTSNYMTGYMSFANKLDTTDLDAMLPWLSSMGLTMLFSIIAMLLVCALTYTMMQLYEQRPNRLQGITFGELSPGILKKSGQQIVMMIFIGIVLSIVGAAIILPLVLINPAMGFLGALLLFLLLPLTMLASPIYMFENISVVRALLKSIRLGWKTWAGIVAVITVLYILVAILEGVVSIPWYVMITLKNIFSVQNSEPAFISSFGYTAIQYVLGVISNFCGSCLSSLVGLGIAYQYGHACDKVDGVTVDRDIENFESLQFEA